VCETQNAASYCTGITFIQRSACNIIIGFAYCNVHWLNSAKKTVVFIIFAVSVLSVTLQSDVQKCIC